MCKVDSLCNPPHLMVTTVAVWEWMFVRKRAKVQHVYGRERGNWKRQSGLWSPLRTVAGRSSHSWLPVVMSTYKGTHSMSNSLSSQRLDQEHENWHGNMLQKHQLYLHYINKSLTCKHFCSIYFFMLKILFSCVYLCMFCLYLFLKTFYVLCKALWVAMLLVRTNKFALCCSW